MIVHELTQNILREKPTYYEGLATHCGYTLSVFPTRTTVKMSISETAPYLKLNAGRGCGEVLKSALACLFFFFT